MKLDNLLSNPDFSTSDCDLAIDILAEFRKYGNIKLPKGYMGDWVSEQVEKLARNKHLVEFSKSYLNHSTTVESDTKVSLSIYTRRSDLDNVLCAIRHGVKTSSKLSKVRGKKDLLTDTYEYAIEFDVSNGDRHRRTGALLATGGAIRVLVLVAYLEHLHSKN